MNLRGAAAAGIAALLLCAAQANGRDYLQEKEIPLPPPPAACKAAVSAHENAGIATVAVENPCPHGGTIAISYQNERFIFPFSGEHAQGSISLFAAQNDLVVDPGDGKTVSLSVGFPQFATLFKVGLTWQAPVQLNLHVLEPFATLASDSGHVFAGNPNRDGRRGLGSFDLVGTAPEGTRIQDYALPDAPQALAGLLVGVRVENVSRGQRPDPEYCGQGRFASVPFRLRILDHGKLRDTAETLAFAPAPCGAALDRGALFLRPLRHDPAL